MRSGPSLSVFLFVVTLCAVAVGLGERFRSPRPATRFFMPGPIGVERGGATDGGQRTDDGGRRTEGFLTRAFSGLRGRDGAEWGKHNGLTPSLHFSHNLNNVFPPELYKTHPEFFPLVEGKRLEPPKGSYFWNPDIARPDAAIHAAKVAREYFEKNPHAVSFALGVNDALIWGESAELLALRGKGQMANGSPKTGEPLAIGHSPFASWFRNRPDYSNVVFTFMNRAAAALSRTHPDKYLGALAYYWCENTPDFPLHPQVVPFLTADRSQGYDAGFWKEEMGLQERWGKLSGSASRITGAEPAAVGLPLAGRPPTESIHESGPATSTGTIHSLALAATEESRHAASERQRQAVNPKPETKGRLGLYDYVYGAGFLVPRIHTALIAASLRHAHRVGFTDYFAEVNPNWGLDGPMPWLVAQLLQNPEQAREALLDEYYARYFQEAAEPMRRFFEKCEELWMAQPGPPYWLKHFRNESQAILFPPDARVALRLMLAEAEVLARSATVKERVRLVSETFGVTERFCALHEARDTLGRACLMANGQSQMANGRRQVANGQSQMANGRREMGEETRQSAKGEQASLGIPPLPIRHSPLAANQLAELLESYTSARRDFIRYTISLRTAQPHALHPVNYDDFLRNNPGFMAAVRILEDESRSGRRAGVADGQWQMANGKTRDRASTANAEPGTQNSDLRRRPEPWIAAAVEYLDARRAGRLRELLSAGSFEGPWALGRRIAGLQYGVDMPSPWQSRLEPTETHVAVLSTASARTGAAGLRISGAVNSTVYQWIPVTGGRTFVASVFARAKISPSHAAMLTLGWLDTQQRHIGTPVVIRIPDGEWPEWIQLMQGTRAPENAAWAGVAIRVQNQLPGDWVEFDDFSLLEVTP